MMKLQRGHFDPGGIFGMILGLSGVAIAIVVSVAYGLWRLWERLRKGKR